jgi:hypothetical protein
LHGLRLNRGYLYALRLEKSQGKLGVTDLHCQRLTPARATAQHLHRLARDKAQLSEAAYQRRLGGPFAAAQTLDYGVGAGGQVRQRSQRGGAIGHGISFV